jgi:peptidyl-prolyl cis-trans isomerase SurA
MALVDRSARMARFSLVSLLLLSGCMDSASRVSSDENRKMDCMARCGEELSRQSAASRAQTSSASPSSASSQGVRPILARSQAPEILPPVKLGNPGRSTVIDESPVARPPIQTIPNATRTPPITVIPPGTPANAAPVVPAGLATNGGDLQVRIVASIGNTPIYDSEVREAVYQRLGEFIRLSETDRASKEKEIYKQELRRIIEREMVVDEMTSFLSSKKSGNTLQRLREAASKEADNRLKMFRADRGNVSNDEFNTMLRTNGLTLSGIRRQLERDFMMQTYIREKFYDKIEKGIGLNDIREYYDSHPDEFKAEDMMKWSDLFVMVDRFKSVAEAQQYAEALASEARKGVDFAELVKKYGHGDSATRGGAGIGEKPGEIFPAELEPALLGMKTGQIGIKATETGFHVLKMNERTVAGRRPFEEKLQLEIRRKVQMTLMEREAKRFVETLWKRLQPQIWIEL